MKDYCTSFPEKILGKYIGDCCKSHDEDYVKTVKRKFIGDWNLLKCVAYKGRPFVAVAMYLAVSTVGWYFWFKSDKE